MLAAEFGYNEDYIDKFLDLDRFSGCLRYRRDYPPISALFKAYIGVKEEPHNFARPTTILRPIEPEFVPESTESEFKSFLAECNINGLPQINLPWKRGGNNGK
jgi:hypothetical protein